MFDLKLQFVNLKHNTNMALKELGKNDYQNAIV
jgi:hypothetical protein